MQAHALLLMHYHLHAAGACSAAGSNGASSEGSNDSADQGVMAWAHLSKAVDSPDPTWQHMSSWIRDNFVTYVCTPVSSQA